MPSLAYIGAFFHNFRVPKIHVTTSAPALLWARETGAASRAVALNLLFPENFEFRKSVGKQLSN